MLGIEQKILFPTFTISAFVIKIEGEEDDVEDAGGGGVAQGPVAEVEADEEEKEEPGAKEHRGFGAEE